MGKKKVKVLPLSKSAKRQDSLGVMTRVLRVRLKDKHARFLSSQAREVNLVWNYCNALGEKVFHRERRFMSGYDFDKYTKGATKEGLTLHSQTVQAVAAEFAKNRRDAGKVRLDWRKSIGSRRSLGWIPVKTSALSYLNGQVHYQGKPLSLWDSYGLSKYKLRTGCFSEDSRGRWYLNVTVDVKRPERTTNSRDVGMDLGLKQFFATSDGHKEDGKRFYRDLEEDIAIAQRANKKDRVKALHQKAKNQRKDCLHKLSTTIIREYGAVFVGNVSASKLAKGIHAKAVQDSSWSSIRTMLRYKSADAGIWFQEVEEAFSTQTCSSCGARCGPKGLEGLGIREWQCLCCGVFHDRDINAAKNILLAGRRWLAEEILGS